MITTRTLEECMKNIKSKSHIRNKYLNNTVEGSPTMNRDKLNSLRFNYTFGVKGIDGNIDLKSFMIKNLDRRMPKRLPLKQELSLISSKTKENQIN